jgi:ribosome maturation protein Sdo1
MIRTIITPDKQDVSIHIPEDYVGKQIEVLLYAVDELNKSDDLKKKKPSDFRGTLKLTDQQYTDFQNHLKDIRDEWERDI